MTGRPAASLLYKYHRQLVLVNQIEAGIGDEQAGQRLVLFQEDHSCLIQVRIVGIGRSALRRIEEKLIEVITIQIVAAVDGHRIIWHVPGKKAAPVEGVVER